MSKRKTPTRMDLAYERGWILQFVLSRLEPDPCERVAIIDVFTAYKAWLVRYKNTKSVLTIDGFGRLFPKGFLRKPVCFNYETRNAIIGMKLV